MLEQRMARRERSAFQAQSTVMVQQAWGQHVFFCLALELAAKDRRKLAVSLSEAGAILSSPLCQAKSFLRRECSLAQTQSFIECFRNQI